MYLFVFGERHEVKDLEEASDLFVRLGDQGVGELYGGVKKIGTVHPGGDVFVCEERERIGE